MKKRFIIISFLFLTLIAVLVYSVIRTALYIVLFTKYNVVEIFFSTLLVFGETFVLIHAFGYVINMIRIYLRRPIISKQKLSLKEEPSVAILIASRHEPKDVLENTFLTINNINYKNKSVYFLDDGDIEQYKREAEELCAHYNLKLFRRKERHGAKAGIINDCLKNLKEKYIVMFDADQNPMPEFLNVLVPLMEQNEKLAFIQTPQFYSNIEENKVARASGFQQAVFYEYICEGKSTGGSMFCCGTNVIFRRNALIDAGGLDESTVTEDFATSIKIHSKGWKSMYFNHVYTFGMGPEDLVGYFKQQYRWAIGTITVFKKVVWRFITKPFSLSPVQWWEYLLSSTYYIVGLAYFFLMICPVCYLLFRIPSFFADPKIYFSAFIPYIILSMGVYYVMLTERNYKVKDLFLGQLLGITTFSVYIRAAFSAIAGIKTTFGITEKKKGKSLPYTRLWPQMAMLYLCFTAFVWGMNRYIYEREPAIIMNGFWALYHFLLLSGIFYFNEE